MEVSPGMILQQAASLSTTIARAIFLATSAFGMVQKTI
jgi:hypothetical protein